MDEHVRAFFFATSLYMRAGGFSSVRELETSVAAFLALQNIQPKRYVRSAKGKEILNKAKRARETMPHSGEWGQ